MKKLALLVCCLLLACASTSKDKAKQSEAYFSMGLSFIKEEKFQDAFVEFQKAVEADPRNKEAHNALGLMHLRFEDLEKAEKSFKKAIDLDNNFSEAYTNLGVVYSKQKQWEKAIEQFQNALRNPVYAWPERAYTNIGYGYLRLKKPTLAIRAFRDAIRRVPNFPQAYYGLALSYNASGDYGEAAASITEGIKADQEINGNKQKAVTVFRSRMQQAVDEQDRNDYKLLIDILHY